jgi:hypothetical protein
VWGWPGGVRRERMVSVVRNSEARTRPGEEFVLLSFGTRSSGGLVAAGNTVGGAGEGVVNAKRPPPDGGGLSMCHLVRT